MWSHKQTQTKFSVFVDVKGQRVYFLHHRQIFEEHQILEKPAGLKIK